MNGKLFCTFATSTCKIKDKMKKILLLLTALLTLSACQESMEDRAARDAEETTAKRCPMRLNDEGTLILERITFDKSTRVWKQDFLLDAAPETLEQIDMHDILLKDLKNQPSYKPYMESKFIFQYVYCDMKNPTDTLVDIRLTPKDYE